MKFGIATFVTDEGVRPDALGAAMEETLPRSATLRQLDELAAVVARYRG